ncbi:hypothetical protein BS17DRAFT_791912 [Gyrodon lividus]|nr:hypothetical protein BS17DRAFT_791912 [Gyrodon lividus]
MNSLPVLTVATPLSNQQFALDGDHVHESKSMSRISIAREEDNFRSRCRGLKYLIILINSETSIELRRESPGSTAGNYHANACCISFRERRLEIGLDI